MENNRREYVWGAFLLRFSLGLLFFVAGLGKFISGLANAHAYLQGAMAKSWLPAFLYTPFNYAVPFVELILGALIILGLWRFGMLVLGSLYMLALAFGMMVAGTWPVVSANLVYVALFAAALFTSRWDLIKLDTLLGARRPGGR